MNVMAEKAEKDKHELSFSKDKEPKLQVHLDMDFANESLREDIRKIQKENDRLKKTLESNTKQIAEEEANFRKLTK